MIGSKVTVNKIKQKMHFNIRGIASIRTDLSLTASWLEKIAGLTLVPNQRYDIQLSESLKKIGFKS